MATVRFTQTKKIEVEKEVDLLEAIRNLFRASGDSASITVSEIGAELRNAFTDMEAAIDEGNESVEIEDLEFEFDPQELGDALKKLLQRQADGFQLDFRVEEILSDYVVVFFAC